MVTWLDYRYRATRLERSSLETECLRATIMACLRHGLVCWVSFRGIQGPPNENNLAALLNLLTGNFRLCRGVLRPPVAALILAANGSSHAPPRQANHNFSSQLTLPMHESRSQSSLVQGSQPEPAAPACTCTCSSLVVASTACCRLTLPSHHHAFLSLLAHNLALFSRPLSLNAPSMSPWSRSLILRPVIPLHD